MDKLISDDVTDYGLADAKAFDQALADNMPYNPPFYTKNNAYIYFKPQALNLVLEPFSRLRPLSFSSFSALLILPSYVVASLKAIAALLRRRVVFPPRSQMGLIVFASA